MWVRGVSGLDFETFYASEFQRVFKAVYLCCSDRPLAHDATQEAFQLAFVRWRRLSRESWAGGWVMTTALNLMRKDRKRPRDADLSRVAPAPAFDRYDTELLDLLRELPQRQRAAVLLYYVADMPVRDVAEAMDVAEGTVKALLAQARDKLRTTLGDHVER